MKITRSLLQVCFACTLIAGLSGPAQAADAIPAAASTTIPTPQFIEIPASKATLKQLLQGGYALYLRHGPTDNSKPDRVPSVDLDDCTTQRPLTEAGRKMMAEVGKAMRKARIPLGDIRISPLCRVKHTVAAALPGQAYSIDNLLMYTANLTDAQKAPIIANTRRLLSTPVTPGSNSLVVAHAPNLMDLIGYFPKEGTLIIFQPKGEGRFDYIASIPPPLWSELLR
jgi:phosphohistidine phosphatase SixA